MSEEYYEDEYEDYSDEQYDDAYWEGYEDGLEEEIDDIEAYEDDELDYPHSHQDASHLNHTALGAAMGYAAAKSGRETKLPKHLQNKLNSLSDEERALVYRQVREQMQRQDKHSDVYGCLLVILIIIACLVCC
ncbi:MAG: hypothetical protein ACI3YX_01830 [Prevotella sp.]